MPYIQARGRIRSISTRHPLGFRVCDRCGCQYTRDDLRWQYEWQGATLQNQRKLVCPTCLDIPNPQLRTYVPAPDPLPFWNPRVEQDRGWPMETYVIYCTRPVFPIPPRGAQSSHIILRTTDGIVITTSGGLI